MSKKIKVDFTLNNVLMFQTVLSGDLLNENKEDNIIRIPKKVLNKRMRCHCTQAAVSACKASVRVNSNRGETVNISSINHSSHN